MRGDDGCQHCRTDAPNTAALTVTLRCLAAGEAPFDGGKRGKVAETKGVIEDERRMAGQKVFGRCNQRSFQL